MIPGLHISTKTKNLWRNYLLMIGTYFISFFLLGFLNSVLPSINLDKYQQTELFNFMNESPLAFICMAVIIAPILEESLFRSLIKPSYTELNIFVCALACFIGIGFIPAEANAFLKYSLVFLSAVILFLFLNSLTPSRFIRLLRVWLWKNYRITWMLMAFLFGLVHIWNYVEGWQLDLVLFLLIFPRIIAGFFFGKIKIENHYLIWPILMHAMNNGIVVFFLLPSLI